MAAAVYTPGREGTLASDMIAAARRNGRVAVPVTSLPALLAELAAGNPVIVFQNLGLGFVPRWHYAVAFGYDLAAGRIAPPPNAGSGIHSIRPTVASSHASGTARIN